MADPAGSFQLLLLGNTETPTLTSLRDNLRYLDVDKPFYQGFVDSLSANNSLSREFLTHRFELYHAANYRAHQSMQRLVEELSALLPLTTADLLEDGPVSSLNSTLSAPAPAPKPVPAEAVAQPAAVVTPSFAPAPAVPEVSAATPVAVPAPVAGTAPAPSPVRPLPNTEAAPMPLQPPPAWRISFEGPRPIRNPTPSRSARTSSAPQP